LFSRRNRRRARGVQSGEQAGIQPEELKMHAFTPFALFLFLAVSAVALFTFIAVASWTRARKEERIALYRSELLKKVAEQPGEGARQVLEILRQEAAQKELAKRRGLLLAGMITGAVGIGVMVMLSGIKDPELSVWTVGLFPFLIGLVMVLFAWFGMRPRQAPQEPAVPLAEPR